MILINSLNLSPASPPLPITLSFSSSLPSLSSSSLSLSSSSPSLPAGHSLPSYFDHLREACVVDGYDSVIRQGPLNEAKLVIVGEQPMISLYRLNKVN